MALTETPEPQIGWQAADFALKGVDGNIYTLNDVKGKSGFVVMFICNHCPYVRGIMDRLPQTMNALKEHGIGVVAINSNDFDTYPEDDFAHMKKFAKDNGFGFPYVIDPTQEIAKKYGAVCTPDFFGFNAEGKLVYRGRLDDAGENAATENTVPELLNAMLTAARSSTAPEVQNPSMGCSIKWKPDSWQTA